MGLLDRISGALGAIRHAVESAGQAVTSLGGAADPQPQPLQVVPAAPGQCASIPEVIDRMRAAAHDMPPGDGVGDFHRMYLLVTERVGATNGAGGFANAAFMERLDCVFAGLYLDAVGATDESRCAAWQPLFERRATPGIVGLQHALAGMNAHINNDLGIAVVRTCRQTGLTLDSPGVHEDYLAVNTLLASAVEEVRQSYLDGLALEVDRQAAPVLDLVGGWSIERARDAAWVSAQVQWALQRDDGLYAAYLASRASAVGLVTRQLLTPLGGDPAPTG